MIDEKKAKIAALKFLRGVDTRATHKYQDVRIEMANIMGKEGSETQDYQETLNSAMGMAFFKGYKISAGEVYFTPNCWHELISVVADELKYGTNYMSYQISDITKSLLGIDIPDVVSLLLAHKLISSHTKMSNCRYITVYTKTW